MRRNLLRSLLLLLCVCLVLTTVFAEEVCDHDYALVAYQPPRHRADGFERYRCTKCGDEYETRSTACRSRPSIGAMTA